MQYLRLPKAVSKNKIEEEKENWNTIPISFLLFLSYTYVKKKNSWCPGWLWSMGEAREKVYITA